VRVAAKVAKAAAKPMKAMKAMKGIKAMKAMKASQASEPSTSKASRASKASARVGAALCPRRLEHPNLGDMKATYASAKSYVCFKDKTTNKWTLLFGVSQLQSPLHQQKCAEIFKMVVEKGLSKEKSIELRGQVIGT
jgi:hypothetical protein